MMSFFSPIRPLIEGWLLSVVCWGLVGFAMAAHGVTTRGDTWVMHLEPSLRAWLPWAFFTPLIFRLVSRMPIDRQRWKLALPVHLVCCAAVMIGFQWWKETLNLRGLSMARDTEHGPRGVPDTMLARFPQPPNNLRERDGFGGLPGPPPDAPPDFFDRGHPPGPPGRDGFGPPGFRGGERPPPPSSRPSPGGRDRLPPLPGGPFRGTRFFDMVRFMSFELPIYLMLLTGAHAALFFRREQERTTSLAKARLDALRMQLQPHFLFNTLNTIAGLIHEEPDKADAMLTSLSELLRMSLDASKEHEQPLQRELDFIQRFLELMHARFEDRLRFGIEAESETRVALVPPMLLQPLVENAVEHGLGPKPGGGLITVRAWREGETLRLSVSDNGVGISSDTTPTEGIGLGNTRARLRELYGERASLTLRNGSGTTAEINLPYHISKAVHPSS